MCYRPKNKVSDYIMPQHVKPRGLLMALTTSSLPHSAPVDKVPWANNSPYQGDQAQFLLIPEWWDSVLCQLVELFKQADFTLQ